jgi:hypothetical protein
VRRLRALALRRRALFTGRRGDHTAIVSMAVKPLATLPVTVASSSEAPSLKTLSVASVMRDRFVALPS